MCEIANPKLAVFDSSKLVPNFSSEFWKSADQVQNLEPRTENGELSRRLGSESSALFQNSSFLGVNRGVNRTAPTREPRPRELFLHVHSTLVK